MKKIAHTKTFKEKVALLIQKRAVQFGVIPVLCLLVAFGVSYSISQATKQPKQASVCEASACVALSGSSATPDTVVIEAGQYVQFNAADNTVRSLELGRGEEGESDGPAQASGGLGGLLESAHEQHGQSGDFASGDFGAGEAWRVQFKEKGTYYFHDSYNPGLSIIVVAYVPGEENRIE